MKHEYAIVLVLFFTLTGFAQADPALKAFTTLNNDTFTAGGFCDDVQNSSHEAVREDEKIYGETWFGYASVCTDPERQNCRVARVRPVSEIARHWLNVLQRDWTLLKRQPSTSESAALMTSLEQTMKKPDSAWSRLTVIYCASEPNGTYTNLDGSNGSCSR